MKMDRASIERLKSRGAHIISERPSAKPEKPAVIEKPVERVREIVVAPAREDIDAAKIASVAALEAAEQMGVIAKKMMDVLSRQKDSAPVAYKFTMERDRSGRLVSVTAEPIVKKDRP